MADSVMFNVPANFNMNFFAQQLADKYRAEGYTVNVANLNGSVMMTIEKKTGGIKIQEETAEESTKKLFQLLSDAHVV